MYPSGKWEGFWVQEHCGKQSMRAFELRFADGAITGSGTDIVGKFTITGAYDKQNGRVLMLKQYIAKHAVQYAGDPDGEGSIQGTWTIDYLGLKSTGTFLLRPTLKKPTGDEPIREIGEIG